MNRDEEIQAWLDHELDEKSTVAFETGLLENEEDRQVAARHLALHRALHAYCGGMGQEQRIIDSVHRDLTGKDPDRLRSAVIAELAQVEPTPARLPPPEPGGMPMLILRVIAGRKAGQTITIDSDHLELGSSPDADVVLEDPGVSRHHARLVLEDGKLTLTDLGSTNGTSLNGGPVKEPALLARGDRIGIGKVRLLVLDGSLLGTVRLLCVHGPLIGHEVPVTEVQKTLGRKSDNDIPLQDQAASGRHSAVWLDGARVMVEDLGSSNGTFLDGHKIAKPTVVHSGGRIVIAHNEFVLIDGRIEDLRGTSMQGHTLLERVGAGTSGVVYKAKHHETGDLVAIKFFEPALSGDRVEAARIQNAVRAIERVPHAHLLPVRECNTYKGLVYMAMPWVANGSLGNLIANEQEVPEPVLACLAQDAVTGLAEAEAKGLTHTGLAAGDLLISDDGLGLVADFGLTGPDQRPNGPSPMSIVQAEMGAILLKALALRRGSSDERSTHSRLHAVVQRMADPDPAQRFASWDDLKTHLRDLIDRPQAGRMASATPAPRPRPAPPPAPGPTDRYVKPADTAPVRREPAHHAAPGMPGWLKLMLLAVFLLAFLLIAVPLIAKKGKASNWEAPSPPTVPRLMPGPPGPPPTTVATTPATTTTPLPAPPEEKPPPVTEAVPPTEKPPTTVQDPPTGKPPVAVQDPPAEKPPETTPAASKPARPAMDPQVLARLLSLARKDTWEEATVVLTDGSSIDGTVQPAEGGGLTLKARGQDRSVPAAEVAGFTYAASGDIYARSGDQAVASSDFAQAIDKFQKAIGKTPHPWVVLRLEETKAKETRRSELAQTIEAGMRSQDWAGLMAGFDAWLELMRPNRLDKEWKAALEEAFARTAFSMSEEVRAAWQAKGRTVNADLKFDATAPDTLKTALAATEPTAAYEAFQKAMKGRAPMDDAAWLALAKACSALKKHDEAVKAVLMLSAEAAKAPEVQTLSESIGLKPPALAPSLLCLTYIGGAGSQAITEVSFNKNGTAVAKGNGFQFLYDPAKGKGHIIGDISQDLGSELPHYKPDLQARSVTVPATGETLTIGYKQASGNLQQPYLTSGAGWKFWGWGKNEVEPTQVMADSRGYDLWLFPDGRHVGVLCWCDGGNSVLSRHPQNLEENLEKSAVFTGGYSNVIGGMSSMVLKIDAISRKPVSGAFLASHVFFHAQDAWGRFYVPKQVARRQAASTLTDPFGVGPIKEAGLFVLDSDLKTNLLHIQLGGNDATTQATGLVAVSDNLCIVGGYTDAPSMRSVNPVQDRKGGGVDALVAIIQLWPKPGK